MRKLSFVLATTLVALLLGSACGGGDNNVKRALEALVESDLAIMFLPQEELGDEFGDLEVDEDSGFNNNEDEADDTADPDDTAEDLEQAGRINGYDLLYIDPDLSALEEGQGVITVNTGLDLFEDSGAASNFIADQVDDFVRLEGEEIDPGFTLEEVETFAVSGLGDEAVGLRLRASFGDVPLYGTTIGFKLDRLVGSVTLNRADDTNVDSQAEEIAQTLEKRIEGVLLGDITGTPVPIPEEAEEAEGRAPSEPPFPDEMALSLEDLPEGASVERERYVEDPDTVSNFTRNFDVTSVDLGSSRAITLVSEIQLYADAREAAGVSQIRDAVFTGESGRDIFEDIIVEDQEFEIALLAYEVAQVPDLADERLAIQYSYDTPLGEFDGVLMNFRVGRAIGILTVEALAGNIELRDIVGVAQAMAARMEATLEAAGEETVEDAPAPPQQGEGAEQSSGPYTGPYTFSGRGDATTDVFCISESQFEVAWTVASNMPEFAFFSGVVFFEGESAVFETEFLLEDVGSGSSNVLGPGCFYIDVLAANLSSWTATVTQ